MNKSKPLLAVGSLSLLLMTPTVPLADEAQCTETTKISGTEVLGKK